MCKLKPENTVMIQQKMPIFIPLHKYINVFAKDIISVLHCILKVGSYGIMMFPTTICFVIFLSFIQKLHQRILHFSWSTLSHRIRLSRYLFSPLSLWRVYFLYFFIHSKRNTWEERTFSWLCKWKYRVKMTSKTGMIVLKTLYDTHMYVCCVHVHI